MARLTDQDREALLGGLRQSTAEPPLSPEERFVAPTVEARARYIRFATQASRFFKGEKPVRFTGDHWKL